MDQKDQKTTIQNRLLIVSSLLLFFYYAEAKIEGISLIGAKIQFNNEEAILLGGLFGPTILCEHISTSQKQVTNLTKRSSNAFTQKKSVMS